MPFMSDTRVTRATLGGTAVDLMSFDDAVGAIIARATDRDASPLGVISANLDHVQHFGRGGRWAGSLDYGPEMDWLTLVDGAPLRAEARRLTGRTWPRLAGSDLIGPLLDGAVRKGLRVGFLGGSPETQRQLRDKIAAERPELVVAGWWSPDRETLSSPVASGELADEVARAGLDMLVVGMGKPRQELWIARYGARTGARVLLAFGAVVDFLAGRITRAPSWVSRIGFEWAWRLMLEPARLANRYLVDGPEAYLRLRRASHAGAPEHLPTMPKPATGYKAVHHDSSGTFRKTDEPADVAVVIVTYNNAHDVGPLLESLRAEAVGQSLKVIVADNASQDDTLLELARYPDVIALPTGGNLGYAGGINAAMEKVGRATAVLVLNPDLRVQAGAIAAMRARMAVSGAGIVVPALFDEDGTVYPSLRREPTISRSMGDALFGRRLRHRPGWLSELDYFEESYLHPHLIEWATGAALLVDADIVEAVGNWDERFFLYSEETDFFRRARDVGASIWFEPGARMQHRRGGSGASPQLTALMAINRIRYAEKHLAPYQSLAIRASVVLAEVARSYQANHRPAALASLSRRRWDLLPQAVTDSSKNSRGLSSGCSIYPGTQ